MEILNKNKTMEKLNIYSLNIKTIVDDLGKNNCK